MSKREKILECLNDMTPDDLVCVWNEFCNDYRCEDYIEFTDQIDDLFGGCSVSKILDVFGNSGFSMADRYYYIDGCGEAVSMNDPMDGPIDLDDLADYILRHDDSLYNDEIREILDETEETEESEEMEKSA